MYNPVGRVGHQPLQETIDAYMGASAGDQDDGEDEDPQTQQDYDDFKKWLDKRQGKG